MLVNSNNLALCFSCEGTVTENYLKKQVAFTPFFCPRCGQWYIRGSCHETGWPTNELIEIPTLEPKPDPPLSLWKRILSRKVP